METGNGLSSHASTDVSLLVAAEMTLVVAARGMCVSVCVRGYDGQVSSGGFSKGQSIDSSHSHMERTGFQVSIT